MAGSLLFFNGFDFTAEDVEHGLYRGLGLRASLEVRPLRVCRRGLFDHRRGLAIFRDQFDRTAGHRLRNLLHPAALALELRLERAMLRRERQRKRVGRELDLLRLREDHAVQRFVPFADGGEQGASLGRIGFREWC